MRITFQEVKVRAERAGKCEVCGKRTKRTKVFMQTLNPWNVTTAGIPKTTNQIYVELGAEARAWQALPILCREHDQELVGP